MYGDHCVNNFLYWALLIVMLVFKKQINWGKLIKPIKVPIENYKTVVAILFLEELLLSIDGKSFVTFKHTLPH